MTKQTYVFQSFLSVMCYFLSLGTRQESSSCDAKPTRPSDQPSHVTPRQDLFLSTSNSRRKSVLHHNGFFNVWIVVLLVETLKYVVIH